MARFKVVGKTRVYLKGKEPHGPVLYVDEYEHNANWTKQSWDFPETIQDAATFRRYLKSREQSVAEFKKLFVYKANLNKIPWLKDL
jgi:hypothetical protein